ncbi:N-acetylneuraminate synthase family protein [Chloroflexota bacterium]
MDKTTRIPTPVEMRVSTHVIGDGHPTFFVVEEGQANDGNYELAIKIIGLAARVGADAIEFQFAIADDFYVSTHPNHAIYKAREFSQEQLIGLQETATKHGILISASPLSDCLVERLVEAGYSLFNVNSSDIGNPRILDAIAETKVPLMIGTAMATTDEIDWAVKRLQQHRCGPFCLLHGQHVMTTSGGGGVAESDVSLSTIRYLRDRYHLPVGYIDHTSTEMISALAVSHGAVVVTKHLSPRPGWRGPDWQICLTPEKMTKCIQFVRLADVARGNPEKVLTLGELSDRSQMRRSIVAKCDLPIGTVLRAEHLLLKRPGAGLESQYLESIIGKRLNVSVKGDEQIQLDYLV